MGKKVVVFFVITFIVIFMALNHRRILRYFYPRQYNEYVEKYAKFNNLDTNLVYALIRTESKFNHEAISHKGALGLMQITPQTGSYISKLLGDESGTSQDLLNPEVNIKYGCYYLSKLYKDFQDNLDYVLAAYNGGEGNVRKWLRESEGKDDNLKIEDIPFAETRQYVNKVKRSYIIYKYLYESKYFNH